MEIYEIKDEDGTWIGCKDFEWTPQFVEKMFDHLVGEQRALFDRVCAGLPCPQAYITKHAKQYGWNDYLLREARLYKPSVLPRPIRYHQPNWKCYETSFAYAEKHGLRYVEGLAINPSGAMLHAWCSTDGTDVIDYTWPYQDISKYFGIEFEIEWLKEKGYPYGGVLGYLELETRKKLASAA